MRVDAIEIDPVIVEVASEWFDFKPSSSVKVHVKDAMDYVREKKEQGA